MAPVRIEGQDVTLSEEASRFRKGSAPETTALLRRVVVSMLHRAANTWDDKLSLRIRRKTAGWSTDALERILFGKLQKTRAMGLRRRSIGSGFPA